MANGRAASLAARSWRGYAGSTVQTMRGTAAARRDGVFMTTTPPHGHDGAARERDASAHQRDVVADRRDRVADGRDERADARDLAVEAGDVDLERLLRRAIARDVAAERRDRSAERRDARATGRTTDGQGPASTLLVLTQAVQHATWDRFFAGRDRDAAAGDRADLIEALRAVSRARKVAAHGREQGAWDRLESGGDRIMAGNDREQAADDRAYAANDSDSPGASNQNGSFADTKDVGAS